MVLLVMLLLLVVPPLLLLVVPPLLLLLVPPLLLLLVPPLLLLLVPPLLLLVSLLTTGLFADSIAPLCVWHTVQLLHFLNLIAEPMGCD